MERVLLQRSYDKNYVPVHYFGEFGIDFDGQVIDQISTAAKLPVALKGAVMPDAHMGYALPIGGVIALDNAVSPNFVGVDIACRMKLSMWDYNPLVDRKVILQTMRKVSRFGIGAKFQKNNMNDHAVMSDPLWNEIPILKENKARAQEQLGTSGGGNHFFDFMEGVIVQDMIFTNGKLPEGVPFHAIMTHSGSRGVGHACASHYYNHAKEYVASRANDGDDFFKGIEKGYEWLPLDYDLGAEYWNVMQLMGRYASANHECIHTNFFNTLGFNPTVTFENHHNFAWKTDEGIVHRKGATPAGLNEIGIIPGTGQTESFVTVGIGNELSLQSSSHGAGRISSRKQAKKNIDVEAYKQMLTNKDIMTSGVAADETYQAYKDITRVIDLQTDADIIRIAAVMRPKIVVMGGAGRDNALDRVTISNDAEME